jgi:hypothetical protein
VLVETVAAETVKTVAFASLLGVLVLVFALQKGDMVRLDPSKVQRKYDTYSGRGGGRRLLWCIEFLLFGL